ncbi:MAG: hypothetical protein WBP45_12485 [Daejeonella sp.]
MTPQIKPIIYIFSICLIAILISACNGQTKSGKPLPQEPKVNTKLRLLTYGGPPDFYWESAKKIVADRWNIEYYSVADCEIDQKLLDSVEEHNKHIEKIIENKEGKDWEARFDKDLEQELLLQNKIITLLDKQDKIIKKRRQLKKANNDLHYDFKPINDQEYQVNAEGWEEQINEGRHVIYYQYLVDTKNLTAKFISEK